jgi:hypothetical protein
MSAAGRPALLVAIDTEGDNQWDAHGAPHSDLREHLRARPPARFFRAPRRPADVRHHPPGRDRCPRRRRAATPLRAAMRNRRAPPRVGDAAV